MPSEAQTAFFSYCREDSEFALKLAEDLKAAGANVWIDQLDIDAGELWDRAVENALANSPRMIVLLSPAALRSENVQNEISRALRKRKKVIPAMYLECEAPLHLERIQYIDLRADYPRGLQTLLRALGVQAPEAAGAIGAAQGTTRERPARKASEEEVRQQKPDQLHRLTAELPAKPNAGSPAFSLGKHRNAVVGAAILLIAIGLTAYSFLRAGKRETPAEIKPAETTSTTQAPQTQTPVRQGPSADPAAMSGSLVPLKPKKTDNTKALAQPSAGPGVLELQKAQELFLSQQLLEPVNNCALYWAIQATASGNSQAPDLERRIQRQVHDEIDEYLQAQNYAQAERLIQEMEGFYPGKFQAWKAELANAQQTALAAAQSKTAETKTNAVASSGGHSFRVQHRHLNKANIFFKTANQEPAEWSYSGTLTVAPDGAVTFRCASVSVPQKACEADIEIPAAEIKNVNANDVLHISTTQGNYDFRADGNTMAEIRNEISAAKQKSDPK